VTVHSLKGRNSETGTSSLSCPHKILKLNYLIVMDPTDKKIVSICSYNVHGFNTGLLLLQDLTLSNDIIDLQEHWLCDNNMYKLGMCSDNVV